MGEDSISLPAQAAVRNASSPAGASLPVAKSFTSPARSATKPAPSSARSPMKLPASSALSPTKPPASSARSPTQPAASPKIPIVSLPPSVVMVPRKKKSVQPQNNCGVVGLRCGVRIRSALILYADLAACQARLPWCAIAVSARDDRKSLGHTSSSFVCLSPSPLDRPHEQLWREVGGPIRNWASTAGVDAQLVKAARHKTCAWQVATVLALLVLGQPNWDLHRD